MVVGLRHGALLLLVVLAAERTLIWLASMRPRVSSSRSGAGGRRQLQGLGGQALRPGRRGDFLSVFLTKPAINTLHRRSQSLAQVEARGRRADAELDRLGRLARQRAADGSSGRGCRRPAARGSASCTPLPGRGRRRVRHVAAGDAAVRDLVRQHTSPRVTTPHCQHTHTREYHTHLASSGSASAGGWMGWRSFTQRVEVDHLLVVVQEVDHHLARDVGRQRRDGREHAALRHGDRRTGRDVQRERGGTGKQ